MQTIGNGIYICYNPKTQEFDLYPAFTGRKLYSTSDFSQLEEACRQNALEGFGGAARSLGLDPLDGYNSRYLAAVQPDGWLQSLQRRGLSQSEITSLCESVKSVEKRAADVMEAAEISDILRDIGL